MILVTGGTGFVGSYIIRQLIDKGFQVRAIRRETSRADLLGDYADKVEWVTGDILDVVFLDDIMKDVEKIYHSAAMITFLKKEVTKMFKINVEGTANMVNAALTNNVKKFLHVSSISAFGRSANSQHMIDEETEWKDGKYNTNYAISKYKAECEVWRAQEEGLPTLIINPATILGAGNWNNGTGAIFSKVWDGLSFYTKGMNGFVDVRDVAEITFRLMEKDIENERFIISAENIEFKELFEMIAECLGKKKPRIRAGSLLNGFAWRVEKIRSWLSGSIPIITPETARLASFRFQYDNSKVRELLDYRFIPIEETVKETCRLFLESRSQGKEYATFEAERVV